MDYAEPIVDAQEMKPLDDELPDYTSAEPTRCTLEVNRGFFEEWSVEVGDKAELPVWFSPGVRQIPSRKLSENSRRPETEGLQAGKMGRKMPVLSALHRRNPPSRLHLATFQTVSEWNSRN